MWRKRPIFAAGMLVLVLVLAACRDPIASDRETPAVLADLVAVPGGQLAPACREWFAPPPPAADLVISVPATLTVTPTTVRPAGTVQLPSWTVKNQGTAASNAFSNGFYLSTDAWITAGDVYLGGYSNYALAPGASYTWGGPKVTIPATTAPGDYYIGILVDRTNTTPEGAVNFIGAPVGRECNNFKSTLLKVRAQRIAFSDGGDIRVMHLDNTRTVVTRIDNLTNSGGSWDLSPAWSPDGDKIAFQGHDDWGRDRILVMNKDGSGITPLTSIVCADPYSQCDAGDPSWGWALLP